MVDKIFRECLSPLIVAINNNSDEIINEFENFISYKSVVDINKHVKYVQFIE